MYRNLGVIVSNKSIQNVKESIDKQKISEYNSHQKEVTNIVPEKKQKRSMTTSKKQKFVGTKILIDPETNEPYPMQLNVIEDRDFNFHKVWLQHLVNSLDGISNQRLRLAFWIIDNLDKENQLVMTQRAIAAGSGMSLNTVTRTMKALQEGDPPFLQKINSGAYRVNPDVIWKGSYSNRMGVIYKYKEKASERTSQKEHQEHMTIDDLPEA